MNLESKLPITSWCYHEDKPDLYEELSRSLSLSHIVSHALVNRGIDSVDKGRQFLSPSLKDMHNPNIMQDMQAGVSRVLAALNKGEKITIYGDYDADGVTSVAVLVLFLRTVDAKVDYQIPERISDGYGLSRRSVEELLHRGTSLLITVDCGISDYEHIAFARSKGMDVIVIDHHEVPKLLPPACAVINPLRSDCRFPFKHLAAVGIAFNFVVALRGAMRSQGFWSGDNYPNLKDYLDLVALGTIGDIVPLVDENRLFIKVGLELLSSQRRVGVKALKEVSGLEGNPIDISKSSYVLIPRINAAGRVAKSDDAVDLFLTDSIANARDIARKLDSYNKKRQDIERGILHDITGEIEKMGNVGEASSFVFSSENWHPGVIGIVASRIVNRFLRPAFLISVKEGIGKGSGRSFAGIDIYQILRDCAPLLLSFGGHRNAAGISIRAENIQEFSASLHQAVTRSSSAGSFIARTTIDADCHFADIDEDLVAQLGLLAPFGTGNPEPVLCARDVSVKSATVVGNNHLRMRLHDNDGFGFDSIWYSKGQFLEDVSNVSLAVTFHPQINNWRGQSSIQLKMCDVSIM